MENNNKKPNGILTFDKFVESRRFVKDHCQCGDGKGVLPQHCDCKSEDKFDVFLYSNEHDCSIEINKDVGKVYLTTIYKDHHDSDDLGELEIILYNEHYLEEICGLCDDSDDYKKYHKSLELDLSEGLELPPSVALQCVEELSDNETIMAHCDDAEWKTIEWGLSMVRDLCEDLQQSNRKLTNEEEEKETDFDGRKRTLCIHSQLPNTCMPCKREKNEPLFLCCWNGEIESTEVHTKKSIYDTYSDLAPHGQNHDISWWTSDHETFDEMLDALKPWYLHSDLSSESYFELDNMEIRRVR